MSRRWGRVVMALSTALVLTPGVGHLAIAPPADAGGLHCGGVPATHGGTPGDDVLVGTPNADVLVGGAGDDLIRGRGGDDLVCGGPGDDVLVGGAGDDRMWGGSGHDDLYGRLGDDRLVGQRGDDLLVGGRGLDHNAAGPGMDVCRGRDRGRRCRGAGRDTVDRAFGTTVTRVSNATRRGGFASPVYSQLQAFSPDELLMLTDGSDGFTVWRLEDMRALPIDTSGWVAPRWDPAGGGVLHYDSQDDTELVVQRTSLEDHSTTEILTLPNRYDRVMVAQSFDEVSRDGRWMAGMAQTSDGPTIFTVDLVARSLEAELVIDDLYAGPCAPDPQWGNVLPDWVGVSPLGTHLVVQWVRDGRRRCSGLETFGIETGAFVGRVQSHHHHGDLGVMPDGTEFFMTFELAHPDDNNFPSVAYRLLPGPAVGEADAVHVAMIGWFGSHISCQGPPGACLVSTTRDGDGSWSPFEAELFFVDLDGSVGRVAHHRSSSCGYWTQPRATVSALGRFVAFASDRAGGGCGGGDLGRGEAFIIDLEWRGQRIDLVSHGDVVRPR